VEIKKSYRPVSCDFIDQVEILALRKKSVRITYSDSNDVSQISDVIATWYTKEKVEYLQTTSGIHIRMDDIIDINGLTNEGTCHVFV